MWLLTNFHSHNSDKLNIDIMIHRFDYFLQQHSGPSEGYYTKYIDKIICLRKGVKLRLV